MQAIDAAAGADAAVALQYFFANIAWVAAHTPFFHAPCRTKRHAAFGNFQVAPAAQIAAIGSLGKVVPIGPATSHFPVSAQALGTEIFCTHASSRFLQKIANTEQDSARTHLN